MQVNGSTPSLTNLEKLLQEREIAGAEIAAENSPLIKKCLRMFREYKIERLLPFLPLIGYDGNEHREKLVEKAEKYRQKIAYAQQDITQRLYGSQYGIAKNEGLIYERDKLENEERVAYIAYQTANDVIKDCELRISKGDTQLGSIALDPQTRLDVQQKRINNIRYKKNEEKKIEDLKARLYDIGQQLAEKKSEIDELEAANEVLHFLHRNMRPPQKPYNGVRHVMVHTLRKHLPFFKAANEVKNEIQALDELCKRKDIEIDKATAGIIRDEIPKNGKPQLQQQPQQPFTEVIDTIRKEDVEMDQHIDDLDRKYGGSAS